MAPRVAVIIYSLHGHIARMAESVKQGVAAAQGSKGSVQIYQVAETLSPEILTRMRAPPKPDYPVIVPDDLLKYDGYLLGVPTRYGTMPAQWRAFWDATGQLWQRGALHRKHAGVFVSSGSLGGGQEQTVVSALSTFAHHGIVFVPLGYKPVVAELSNIQEVHGGSPWGAGTLAGGDGKRQPSELELKVAFEQGKDFYDTLSRTL